MRLDAEGFQFPWIIAHHRKNESPLMLREGNSVSCRLGHAIGWPLPRGGSQQIVNAMVAYLCLLGGEIVTRVEVKSLEVLPSSCAVLCDVTPRQLLHIAGSRLPIAYQCKLQRYRYGPGVFKLDLALDGSIPWQAEECMRAATVHVGGTLREISAAEAAVWRAKHPEKPFVLLAQQSLFDSTRAPAGKHIVPTGCATRETQGKKREKPVMRHSTMGFLFHIPALT